MTSVEAHYENLLAPIYLWMAGGMDAALAKGTKDITTSIMDHPENPVAIDLGAGFGMHAIPLALNSYAVTAIDASDVLLAQLKKHSKGLNIKAINADILNFRMHVTAKADLILCMGDTITHLQQLSHVEHLFAQIADALTPAGRAIITFRDYTAPLRGDARFIPVRSDSDRILSCFLEESGEYMVVHDILYEREGTSWNFRVSSYKKLRISPRWMIGALKQVGLEATLDEIPMGYLRVVAVRTRL